MLFGKLPKNSFDHKASNEILLSEWTKVEKICIELRKVSVEEEIKRNEKLKEIELEVGDFVFWLPKDPATKKFSSKWKECIVTAVESSAQVWIWDVKTKAKHLAARRDLFLSTCTHVEKLLLGAAKDLNSGNNNENPTEEL